MAFRYNKYGVIVSIGKSRSLIKSRKPRPEIEESPLILVFYCTKIDFGTTFSGTCYAITGKFTQKELKNESYVKITHVTDW